jgi:ribosomal protein L21E
MFVRILKKFRDCVRDGKLVVTQHAFEEMNDDDLMQIDVEHCILNGEITERQWDNEFHKWKYIINGKSIEGEAMEVVLKIGHKENSVIITTYLL